MVHVSSIYLVRHGRAAAGWDTDLDPGLDDQGRLQAQATARRLAVLPPMQLVSSPMKRCRETAGFLAAKWGNGAVLIEPLVTEIPSPPEYGLDDRVQWLRSAMAGTWTDLGGVYVDFRDAIVEYVSHQSVDTVIFSHFIAINAVIGSCQGDDRLVIDSLDNASVTVFETNGQGDLRLVERGNQADTLIR